MLIDIKAKDPFENALAVLTDHLIQEFSADEIADWSLVPLKAKTRMSENASNARMLRILPAVAASFLQPSDTRSASAEQSDGTDPEVARMERLTAAWLGLYFLGIPCGQLWERVCHIADEVGSYASSVCAYKAIGDVFRFARQIYIRDFWEETVKPAKAERTAASTPPNCTVTVLTRTPMVLDRSLTLNGSASHYPTDKPSERLGRLYLMLQVALYLRQGLPIRYVVPINAVRQGLKIGSREQAELEADRMLSWLRKIVPEPNAWQTIVLTAEDANTFGVPTFVLGYRSGVATVEVMGTDGSVAFAANRLGKTLVKSYRTKVEQLKGNDLLARNAEERKKILVEAISPEEKTNTPPLTAEVAP